MFFGTVDQQVVAVEDRVVADFTDLAGDGGDQFGPAGGEDVEAFVDPSAVARRAEFTDRTAFAMRPPDREDVPEPFDPTVLRPERDRRGGSGGNGEQQEDYEEKPEPRQWCAMTRSTMLYSFASSALMK